MVSASVIRRNANATKAACVETIATAQKTTNAHQIAIVEKAAIATKAASVETIATAQKTTNAHQIAIVIIKFLNKKIYIWKQFIFFI